MKNTHMQLLLHDTHSHTHIHTDVENTPKTPKDETSQKTTTSHLLKKQTFNYGGSGALVGDQQVLMCASKIALR